MTLRRYRSMPRASEARQRAKAAMRAVYRAVDERSDGRCEVILEGARCRRQATDHHHLVKPRGSHHRVSEIVALCRVHHDRCEWPYQRGRLVIVRSDVGWAGAIVYDNPKRRTP